MFAMYVQLYTSNNSSTRETSNVNRSLGPFSWGHFVDVGMSSGFQLIPTPHAVTCQLQSNQPW